MVSYKELMLAALIGVNAQAGNWTNGGSTGGGGSTPQNNGWIVSTESYTDVTLHVHTHTPIQDYALPTSDYSTRRESGCIGFSNNLVRQNGRTVEPWIMISTDMNDCAVMDITPQYNGEHLIFLKKRVDDAPVGSGYLGTRSESVDKRNEKSGYLSATNSLISTWKLLEYDDGFLIQQASNVNV